MDKRNSQWDPAYTVGIIEIDMQHQQLFELTADVQNDLATGANRETISNTLSRLREYAINHFQAEEQLFKDHPQHDFHQQIHRAFISKIKHLEQDYQEWKTDVVPTIAAFLQHWLVTHITQTDRQFLAPGKEVRDSETGLSLDRNDT